MCREEAGAEGGGGGRRTQSLFPSSSLGGRTSVHRLWHFQSARKEKRLKEISSSGGKEGLGEKFLQAHYAIVNYRTEISPRENFVSVSIFFNQK